MRVRVRMRMRGEHILTARLLMMLLRMRTRMRMRTRTRMMRPHIRLEDDESRGLCVIKHGDCVSDGEREGLFAEHVLPGI